MGVRRPGAVVAAAALLLLAACDRDAGPLPGERLPLRDDPVAELQGSAIGIRLPPARANADWSQRNGTASGDPFHPALAPVPSIRWSTRIGSGDNRRSRIVASPIVAGGLTFALDATGQITAVGRSGQVAWSRSLVPADQRPDGGPGGGLAQAGGVLYVTTGFGEVFAIDPGSGQIRWRETLEAPITAPPVALGNRVYVVLRNDVGYALNAANGAVEWRVLGSGGTGLIGGASPAADGRLVVFPFASGEVLGVLSRNGLTLWGTVVTGGRRELARNQINDISGDPVIAGSAVYASNQSGRTIRMDRDSGERLWTMAEGAYGPVWPVGGSLFFVSDSGALVRADAASGQVLWRRQLPEYYRNRGLFRDRDPVRAVPHFGPVLAGGRLWIASGDARLRAFSPESGTLLAEIELPAGAASAPAVAGGVLFVVTSDGWLHAFQ